MKNITSNLAHQNHLGKGFTLVEVLIASAIAALMMAGLVYGYLMTATRAEWSGYSLAAQSLAQQQLEQTRACKWDPSANPPVDELIPSQFPPVREILDLPINGTNIVFATNFTTITEISADSPLKCIQVDCYWNFRGLRVYSNTVVTYRAPDN